MTAETIIFLAIYILVALLMLCIGISQQRSKMPVGFYTGEKPPTEQELSDVPSWNKKHGAMWILYGIVIAISGAVGALVGISSAWCVVPLIGGVIVPIVLMIWYHHQLLRKYKR